MKRVLITGCSSGFGFDLVSEYLREGWYVVATLRNLEARRNLFIDIEAKFSDRLTLLELDVVKGEDREKVLRFFESQSWGLDCLVNNAGYGLFGALEDISETQVREQFEINFFGVLFLTQTFLPVLRKNRGKVIVISSVVGFMGLPFGSLYSSSKYALEGLFESLSYELKLFGVDTCLIQPGQFRTSFSQKLKYGEHSLDPFSPYFRLTTAFKNYRDERKLTTGIPPQQVVDQVVHISGLKKMPLRIRAGMDSKAGFWFKWLLPEGLYLWLMTRIFGQVVFQNK